MSDRTKPTPATIGAQWALAHGIDALLGPQVKDLWALLHEYYPMPTEQLPEPHIEDKGIPEADLRFSRAKERPKYADYAEIEVEVTEYRPAYRGDEIEGEVRRRMGIRVELLTAAAQEKVGKAITKRWMAELPETEWECVNTYLGYGLYE